MFPDFFIIPMILIIERGQLGRYAQKGLATNSPCSMLGDSGWLSIQENAEVLSNSLKAPEILIFDKSKGCG